MPNILQRFSYSKIKTEIGSMTHLVKKLEEEKKLAAYFDLLSIEGLTGNVIWNEGPLIYKANRKNVIPSIKT